MSISTSQTTEKLDAALAKAQGEFIGAAKDSLNPHFKSKYADLASVWDVIRGPLSKHGLSVSQWPVHSTDGRCHVVTRLAHSGEWIMATYSTPVAAQTAQAFGSAITYAKRYTLMAVLGIPSEDDDGNDATIAQSLPKQQVEPKRQAPIKNTVATTSVNTQPNSYAEALGIKPPYIHCLTFVIPIGKQKGKNVNEVDEKDLKNLAEFFVREHREGKALSPKALDTVSAIQDFFDSRAGVEHDVPNFDSNGPVVNQG